MQGTMNACCMSHVRTDSVLTACVLDSHAHDREVQVKWCVNCHSIVMIQRREEEGCVCTCVCSTK